MLKNLHLTYQTSLMYVGAFSLVIIRSLCKILIFTHESSVKNID